MYVYFIGVNLKYRRRGIVLILYLYFFDVVCVNNCKVVKVIMLLVNKKLI